MTADPKSIAEVFCGRSIAAHLESGIGWIVLGGERPFTVDEDFPDDLTQALDILRGREARAIVVLGKTAVFCAGANLKLAEKLQRRAVAQDWLVRQSAAIARLAECPLPTIAAVQGAAAGAGCNLAIACDHVIAVPNARFSQAFVRIGLAGDMGSLYLLPRRVGFRVARGLMLTGREVAGEEALEIGLADELAAPEDLASRAAAVARERADGSLPAYAAIKGGLARGVTASLADSLTVEIEEQLDLMTGPDFAEGARAFLEKRPPVFNR